MPLSNSSVPHFKLFPPSPCPQAPLFCFGHNGFLALLDLLTEKSDRMCSIFCMWLLLSVYCFECVRFGGSVECSFLLLSRKVFNHNAKLHFVIHYLAICIVYKFSLIMDKIVLLSIFITTLTILDLFLGKFLKEIFYGIFSPLPIYFLNASSS